MNKAYVLSILTSCFFIPAQGVNLITLNGAGNQSVELYCTDVSSQYQRAFNPNVYYYKLTAINHNEYSIECSIENIPTVHINKEAYRNNHYALFMPFNILATGAMISPFAYTYIHNNIYNQNLNYVDASKAAFVIGAITAAIDELWMYLDKSVYLSRIGMRVSKATDEEKSFQKNPSQFYIKKEPTENSIVFASNTRITTLYYTYNAQTFDFYIDRKKEVQ